MVMNEKVQDKLNEFIDAYEDEYGEVEGFQIHLEHHEDSDGSRFSTVKKLYVTQLKKVEVKLK